MKTAESNLDASSDIVDQKELSLRHLKYGWRRVLCPRLSVASMMWLTLLAAILILWYQDHQRLSNSLNAINGNNNPSWSIDQILGAPDTMGFGDISTAWASATPDGREEWVVVEFPNTVEATQVHVRETHCPGAVTRIYSVDMTGKEILVWQGTDPLAGKQLAGGVAKIVFKHSARTRRLRIVLDSGAIAGWNEIDAVALIGKGGYKQWANNAWASSSFGNNRELPTWFWP